MKQHFAEKSFSEELEIWEYLQLLKTLSLDIPDGHYCIEFNEIETGRFGFRCVIRSSDRKALNSILYVRPLRRPRCYIYVRNRAAFCVGIASAYFDAHDEIESNGEWTVAFYYDHFDQKSEELIEFTQSECEAACTALVELAIMNSKKVS